MSILVKHFIVNPKAITKVFELSVSEEEKQKLTETIILLYHQKLLTVFLENLVENDKKLFLESLLTDSHEETISLLRNKIENIEKVVEESIYDLEEKLLKDFAQVEGNN